MAKGKAPGYDGIPMEFFQRYWPTIGRDFLQMLSKGLENGVLHEGVIKGLISLIPKRVTSKILTIGGQLPS